MYPQTPGKDGRRSTEPPHTGTSEFFVKKNATKFRGVGPNLGTHLYQAADIGYVWRGVTHSLILLHLQRKAQIHPSQQSGHRAVARRAGRTPPVCRRC